MAGQSEEFLAHAATGLTTLCRAWAITRADGVSFGFTDHDRPLSFEGVTFKAETGLTASALAQSTGLSVDNTEALGALTDAAVREDDIEAGRFDGAEVRAWLVNWADPDTRWLQFRGTIGELRRAGGAFHAELRGLTEALNRPLGRIYQKPCTAVLGDGNCTFDVTQPGYQFEGPIVRVIDGRVFEWDDLNGFEPAWFQRGRLDIVDGLSAGLWGMIKRDVFEAGVRRIELWEPIRGALEAGDELRLTAGCDKRFETCRLKFNNLLNFQGFPDLPGDDWVMAYPSNGGTNSGGSLR
ncbi:MAG: DUF2163 domain-containing protein [Tateyamaria sp.]|uniref:DUF2163 domain-containing protein n=1 Tax=Tateyamaria sp. TaxID=1929288 RepID=UPI00327DD60E